MSLVVYEVLQGVLELGIPLMLAGVQAAFSFLYQIALSLPGVSPFSLSLCHHILLFGRSLSIFTCKLVHFRRLLSLLTSGHSRVTAIRLHLPEQTLTDGIHTGLRDEPCEPRWPLWPHHPFAAAVP